ncbi:hypothetical protein ACQKWADRAFT_291582 [Trichoderma austrokoningii]
MANKNRSSTPEEFKVFPDKFRASPEASRSHNLDTIRHRAAYEDNAALHQEIAGLTNNLAAKEGDLKALYAEYLSQGQELNKANAAASVAKDFISNLQISINELINHNNKLQDKVLDYDFPSLEELLAGANKPQALAPPLSSTPTRHTPELVVKDEEIASLKTQISIQSEEIKLKDAEIEQLSTRHKTEQDLLEEIENLKENLIDLAQDHVAEQKRIKEHRDLVKDLRTEIAELQKQNRGLTSQVEDIDKTQAEYRALVKEYRYFRDTIVGSSNYNADLDVENALSTEGQYKELREALKSRNTLLAVIDSLQRDANNLRPAIVELHAVVQKVKDLEKDLSQVGLELAHRNAEVRELEAKLEAETEAKTQMDKT